MRFPLRLSIFLVGIVSLATVGGALVLWRESSQVVVKETPVHARARSPFVPDAAEVIPRYLRPFSVVPGGLRSPAELRYSVEHDSQLRAHYAEIRLADVRMYRVGEDFSAYVSYRRNGRIFWTRHRINIRRGEFVLSDGAHVVLSRCGNRASNIQQQPVEPHAPPDEALEVPPALGQPPTIVTSDPILAPVTDDTLTLVPIPVLFLPGDPPRDNPLPAEPTPEPTTWLLLSIGAGSAYLFRRR